MEFRETPLRGAFLVHSQEHGDERGAFFRAFCALEFAAHDLPQSFVQCSISRNRLRGTLRGMHFQKEPMAEGKLVRCIRGCVFDAIIDLRPESATFRRWFGVTLDAASTDALYIPPGFAHGFQTLADDTELLYQITEFHDPALSGGVRWNDPAFGIEWPVDVTVISLRDREFPDFTRAAPEPEQPS